MKIRNELVSIKMGKKKYDFNNLILDEYLKRLSKYTKINLIEVPDENFDITKTLETEKKSIKYYLDHSINSGIPFLDIPDRDDPV